MPPGADSIFNCDGLIAASVLLQWLDIRHTVPEFIATQSSWLYTLAPVITTLVLDPMSKPSVLWPPSESPAESSIVMSAIVSPFAPLMLTA